MNAVIENKELENAISLESTEKLIKKVKEICSN